MSVPAAYISIVIIWSTTPLAVKFSTGGEVSFVEAAALRMLGGALIAGVLLKLAGIAVPWSRDAVKSYASGALAIFAAMTLVYWGAQYVPSGLIALLFGLSPLITALLSQLFLGENTLSPAKIIASLLGIGGLVLIFGEQVKIDVVAAAGLLALLMAVLLYSLSGVLVKRVALVVHPLAQTYGSLVLSLPGYALVWIVIDGSPPTQIEPLNAGLIAYLALFGSVLGFTLYFYVLSQLTVVQVALIPLITPVIALVLGTILAGEQVGLIVMIGSALILSALILHQWGDALFRPRLS